MSISIFQMLAEQRRFGNGKSKGAQFRRKKRLEARGTLYAGRPGEIIDMSNRTYTVAPDGSFRRWR